MFFYPQMFRRVAKLAPGAAVQLGIKVFLQVRDDTLKIHVGDNLRNNNCKTETRFILQCSYEPFPSANHGKLNIGIRQYFNNFLKWIYPSLKATQPLWNTCSLSKLPFITARAFLNTASKIESANNFCRIALATYNCERGFLTYSVIPLHCRMKAACHCRCLFVACCLFSSLVLLVNM